MIKQRKTEMNARSESPSHEQKDGVTFYPFNQGKILGAVGDQYNQDGLCSPFTHTFFGAFFGNHLNLLLFKRPYAHAKEVHREALITLQAQCDKVKDGGAVDDIVFSSVGAKPTVMRMEEKQDATKVLEDANLQLALVNFPVKDRRGATVDHQVGFGRRGNVCAFFDANKGSTIGPCNGVYSVFQQSMLQLLKTSPAVVTYSMAKK
jgi:hypothetical protein